MHVCVCRCVSEYEEKSNMVIRYTCISLTEQTFTQGENNIFRGAAVTDRFRGM